MLLTLVVRTAPGVHVWSGKPSTLLQRSVGAVTDAFSATAFVVAGFVLNPFGRREFPAERPIAPRTQPALEVQPLP
jgi:hypothetical protein